MAGWEIREGDALAQLEKMPSNSVHCVVTSPPYFGLRDYGVAGQLGLEPTPEEYVANMVEIFGAVRRVLRDDGTCWVNMGDSYAGGGPHHGENNTGKSGTNRGSASGVDRTGIHGLKPKDLCGMPWRLAFALQADGWWLRSDIIWAKPNPMPESVTDRPTKAHEYVFLLTKSARYFYDQEAVREEGEGYGRSIWPSQQFKRNDMMTRHHGNADGKGTVSHTFEGGRNLRTVWTIPTEPYPDAHFATFPTALVEPCVKAGTSEHGVCGECGGPWAREVEYGDLVKDDGSLAKLVNPIKRDTSMSAWSSPGGKVETVVPNAHRQSQTIGWRSTCNHGLAPVPATVLDPFAGAGTTGLVANRLGRAFIGIELNPAYCEMARKRIRDDAPLLTTLDEVQTNGNGKPMDPVTMELAFPVATANAENH